MKSNRIQSILARAPIETSELEGRYIDTEIKVLAVPDSTVYIFANHLFRLY